jgi:hypothetical protein
MLLTKLKTAATLLLVVCALAAGAGAGLLAWRAEGQPPQGVRPGADSLPPSAQPPGGAKPADVQGRLAELEKQVQTLTRDLEALRKEFKALGGRPPANAEIKIFTLRNIDAVAAAKALQDLFRAGANERAIRIVGEPNSNSLLVNAAREDLEAIEAVIARLEVTSGKKVDKQAK